MVTAPGSTWALGCPSVYGPTYWSNLRATFVIDADGVIRHVIPKVSRKMHDEDVLAAPAAS
jgi:thioredoxin-dependent peroxiredoxin